MRAPAWNGERVAERYFQSEYYRALASGLELSKEARSSKLKPAIVAFLGMKPSYVDLSKSRGMDFALANQDMLEYYQAYLMINPRRLTAEQKKLVKKFDEYWTSAKTKGLSSGDRELLFGFPWIDPENLSSRDKVFLMNVSRDIAR